MDFQRVHVGDVSVNKSIGDALSRVRQNLVVQFGCALVDFATFGHVVNDLLVEDVKLSHLLVDLGKILDILSCVLDHHRCQWPCLPESLVVLHGDVDLILLFVDLAKVVFQKVVETDIDVPVVILLQEVRDQSVCDLGVKYKVADDVILANKRRCVLTEVMEYFHNVMRLHDLFEAMLEWIDSLQVN